MTLILILLVVAIAAFFIQRIIRGVPVSQTTPAKALSRPSKEIWAQYITLPNESRPDIDLRSVLEELDAQFGADADRHFPYWEDCHTSEKSIHWYSHGAGSRDEFIGCKQVRVYDKYDNTYQGYTYECEYKVYGDLFNQITRIHTAIENQKKSMREAALASSAPQIKDRVALLTERLRAESDIINQVTKEIA